MPSLRCNSNWRRWQQREYRQPPYHPSSTNNSNNNTPVETITAIKTVGDASVAIIAAAVDKVQAAAEAAVDGKDTNNLEQAGHETSNKGGKQIPTRTSICVHRMSNDSRTGAIAGRMATTVATLVDARHTS